MRRAAALGQREQVGDDRNRRRRTASACAAEGALAAVPSVDRHDVVRADVAPEARRRRAPAPDRRRRGSRRRVACICDTCRMVQPRRRAYRKSALAMVRMVRLGMSASCTWRRNAMPASTTSLAAASKPIDVRGRIRLRVAELLRIRQHDAHRLVGLGHPAQDVVARAVENAGHAGQRVARQPLTDAVNERHAAADRCLEPDLRATLARPDGAAPDRAAASSILLAVTTDAPCSSACRNEV